MNPNKYPIERRYINVRQNVRPGLRLTSGSPAFFVAHDTGNPGATAEDHFKYFQRQTERSASAQVFIDDVRILEIIPTGTGPDPAEKAWHVLYNVPTDNDLFGDDANDIALGIELCYGEGIDFMEAYKRFVWYLAFCCSKWEKNPLTHIPSHKQLDPARKRDCDNALATGGKSLKDLVYDVAAEMQSDMKPPVAPGYKSLPTTIAFELIDKYVRPAWAAAKAAGQLPEAEHFSRLSDNLRAAAAVRADGSAVRGATRLPKSNAQEIIYRWLSPAWFKAQKDGDKSSMDHFRSLANCLRTAAGIPVE